MSLHDTSPRDYGPEAAVQWRTQPFAQLSATALYEVLQLRSEIFVVEQACAFQDVDGADAQALHLLGTHSAATPELVAYARLFPAGVKFAEASIGRVAVRESARGGGLGHVLVQQAVAALCKAWGPQPIRIGAQARLKAYYTRHGFVDMDRPYDEDGIAHIEMLWLPSIG